MTRQPWILPAAEGFLDEIEVALGLGVAVVAGDPVMPEGLVEAIAARLHARQHELRESVSGPDRSPAQRLATTLGCDATLPALLQPAYTGICLHIDLADLAPPRRQDWAVFVERFGEARDRAEAGLSLLLTGAAPGQELSHRRPLTWDRRLRRLDLAIWSDLHAPDRPEPLSSLATALAVELCAWRLDIAREIAGAGAADLLDPLGWLGRRSLPAGAGLRSVGVESLRCPLDLLQAGERAELERRIWRAHVAALFPWLEDARQSIIGRHGRLLRLNDHLRTLGVTDIEEIELGALAYQLRARIDRREAAQLETLARIRNALAHRKPASPEDLGIALQMVGRSRP